MVDLILHHFDASPFSEKLRAVLGFKGLAWESVIVPAMMPKPDVVALTGGYRRTPFLQIGADVYCDTALICDVLDNLCGTPTLYPQPGSALARIVAQWADNELFWAAVRHNRGPMGSGLQFGGPPELADALFEDRKAMGFDLDWQRPADATVPYQSYLQRLAETLDASPFLLGNQACIADFSAYHPLWLAHLRTRPAQDLLAPWPVVREWLARMQAFGHGHHRTIDSAQAISLAARSEPMDAPENLLPASDQLDLHGCPPGSAVAVSASSFGTEPTQGILVAATRTHYSVRHENARTGRVHVHFPRAGYVLRQLASERTDMETHRPDRATHQAREPAPGPYRATRR